MYEGFRGAKLNVPSAREGFFISGVNMYSHKSSKTNKISIITPSFNQGSYLEQTIDSVLSQNYPNLEYIIIDGGSIDQSVDIIKKHKKHLAYWVSEPDRGQSAAINKGLHKSTGDIINWLNSDDYYEPYTLRSVAEALQDREVQVVCGRSRLFRNNNEAVSYSREQISIQET